MLTTANDDETGAADIRFKRRLSAAVIIGGTLEWYDFFLYGSLTALVFSTVFFPSENPTLGSLAAFSAFAFGFLARPIGGFVFAHLADKIGRKKILVATMILMGVASTSIAFIPGYDQIGLVAPILLIALRLLQGAAAGAEYAIASVFAVEHVTAKKRGIFGSLPALGVYLGIILSTAVVQVAIAVSGAAFVDWGWRITFIFSIGLVVVGVVIRRTLPETPEFQPVGERPSRMPLLDAVRTQWRSILTVFMATAAQVGLGYLYLVFVLFYVQNVLNLSASIGLWANLLAAVVSLVITPVVGRLGDRFGPRAVYLVGLAYNAVIVPVVFTMLASAEPLFVLVAVGLGSGIGVATLLAVQGAYFSEKFPANTRASGFVIGREMGTAIVGGFTPLLATLLVFQWGTVAVACLAAGLSVIPLVYLLFADRDRRNSDRSYLTMRE